MAHRKATDEDFARLREMSAEYERLAGEQGYAYCSQPESAEWFHFGNRAKAIVGIDDALAAQQKMLDEARAKA